MNDAHHIPHIAHLLADAARAIMVWTLIDGTMRPAGELARAANISPQSASAHLAKLVEGGLLVSEAQGRHRYFQLANAEAALIVEALASFGAAHRSSPRPPQNRSSAFLAARTCYDHLAGTMAVAVMEAMTGAHWLAVTGQAVLVTPLGHAKLAELGIILPEKAKARRPVARCCVDLTQRRPHLAGLLGAALLDFYVRDAWVLRTARSRLVTITPKGHAGFKRLRDLQNAIQASA